MGAERHKGPPKTVFAMEPERVLYPASREELEELASSGESRSKDVCLVSVPLGIAATLGYIAEVTRHEPGAGDFLLLVAYLSVAISMTLVGVTSAWWWARDTRRRRQLLENILNRPIQYVILSPEKEEGEPPSKALDQGGTEEHLEESTSLSARDSDTLYQKKGILRRR